MFDYVGASFLNLSKTINKSSFTSVLGYGKKVVDTTMDYLSSATNYFAPQYAKDLLGGKSAEHYANVASHTKDAAVETAYLGADAVKTAYNAAKVGGQIMAGHMAYHGMSNKVEDTKYMLKAAVYAAGYISPDSLPTRLLKYASDATDLLDKTLDENPMLSQGVLIATMVSATGTAPLINTVKGVTNMAVGAVKVAGHLGCAALEATAGTILYAKETMEGSSHSEVQIDVQNGFGIAHDSGAMTFGFDADSLEPYLAGEVFN